MKGRLKYQVPKNWDLAYLPLESRLGKVYMAEMQFCVDFALANRALMMEQVKASVTDVVKGVDFHEMVNIAHNYAALETHFGQPVIVHRKGATKAFKGTTGIVPGSQGSPSYIVRGRGCRDSFMSCSHGAGRVMGRKQAIRQLDLAQEKKRLDDLGIVHSIRTKKDLDEASSAYKDVERVMKDQADLVDILVELKPLGVIKG